MEGFEFMEQHKNSPWLSLSAPGKIRERDQWLKEIKPYRYAFSQQLFPEDELAKKNKNKNKKNNGVSSNAAEARRQQERQMKYDMIRRERDNAKSMLDGNFELQKQQAKATNDSNMRDIYIAYMQGMKSMPQQTALWGAGGEIESLKNQRRINYEDNRVKQMANYESALNQLQQQYNSDLRVLEEKYLQRLMGI